MVVIVADDPSMHSSQNEQDSRYFAKMGKVPLLEPSDAAEAQEMIRFAYELSERFASPVMFRTTTRLAHTRGIVEPRHRGQHPFERCLVAAPEFHRHSLVGLRDEAFDTVYD